MSRAAGADAVPARVTGGSSHRASKKAELEARVLGVALQLFADRGYHGTSIPMNLEAAGVSASSLYRLHASKEALVNAVFLDAKVNRTWYQMGSLTPNTRGCIVGYRLPAGYRWRFRVYWQERGAGWYVGRSRAYTVASGYSYNFGTVLVQRV